MRETTGELAFDKVMGDSLRLTNFLLEPRNPRWHVTPPPSAVVYSNHMLELLRDGAIPHNDGAPAKLQLSGPPPPGSEPPQRRPPPGVEMTMVSGRSGPQPRFRVFGLTADIAIEAALLAYGRQPEYLFRLSKQPTSRGLLQMWIAGGQLGRGSIINSGREEDDGDHSDPTLKKQKL